MIRVDKIITTVVLSKRASIDMELPVFLPIGELKPKILETVKVIYSDEWNEIFEINLKFMGRSLDDNTSLAASGVWDGSFLEVERRR